MVGRLREWYRARRRLTPLRLQFQTTECGIGALQSILAHFGSHIPAETLRQVTGVSRHCLNARDILAAARHFGLQAKALKRSPEELDTVRLPAIVHVRFIHFMVLEAFGPSEVRLNDPASGRIIMPRGIFDEIFTGIVMEFGQTADTRTASAPDPLRCSKRRWVMAGLPGVFALVCSIAAQFPLATALDGRDASFWPALALSLVVYLAVILFDKAETFMATEAAVSPMHHLGRLDAAFFAYRFSDRLRETIVSARGTAKRMHRALLPGLALLSGAIVLAVMLALRDPWLGLGIGALLSGHGIAVAMLRGWPSGVYRLEQGFTEITAASVEPTLHMAAPLKFGRNAENHRQALLGTIAAAWHRGLRPRRRQMVIDLAGATLVASALTAAALLGHPSAGEVFLIFAIADSWRRGVSAVLAAHGLQALLWHTADIMHVAPADLVRTPQSPAAPGAPVLELRAITFGYTKSRPPVLRDVSLTLQAGEQIGITGPSGHGKSSLAAIAAGLHTPWSGAVLHDGRPIAAIPASAGDHGIALIDRHSAIFEGTLRDNLTLWSDAFADDVLIGVLKVACLWSEVAERGGLGLRLAAEGSNLSLGQAQRLEIARALLLEPRIIALDECLDALDLALERQIRASCRQRGIALLIVSHRKETLAACDRVISVGAEVTPAPASIAQRSECDNEQETQRQGNDAAIRRIATALGVQSSLLGKSDGGDVPALAGRRGLIAWRARLPSTRWWLDGSGPMLAVRIAERRPIALIADRSRYHLWDGDGPPVRVDASALRGLILPEIWAFQRIPDLAASPVSAMLRAGWRDTVVCLASAALRGLACLLPAIVLTTGTGRFALALGLLAVLSLAVGDVRARLRSEIQRDSAMMTWLLGRLARLQVRFVFELPTETRGAAQAALGRLLAACHELPQATICDAVTLFGSATFLIVQPVYPVGPLLTLFLVALTGPSFLMWHTAEARRRHGEALQADVRFLDQIFASWSRLHTLNAWQRMVARWRELRPGGTASASARLLRSWPLMTGPALLACATITALPPSPGVMAFSCLGLSAAIGLGTTAARLTRIRTDAVAVARVLDGPTEDGRRPPGPEAREITLHGVSFRYPGQAAWALRDVSLTLRPGRIVAITGASGSGKTTLLNVILGLDRPEVGAVRAGGVALERLELQEWRDGIGAVLQRSRLDRAGTIRSQVAGPTQTSEAAVWEALRLAEVADEVAARPMGLQSIVEYSSLSGGEQQRILIARALLRRPWLLVLDEATSAIPQARQVALLATLRRLGIGCIMSTHRPSVIALADDVFILEGGRLRYAGPPSAPRGDPVRQSPLDADGAIS